MINELEQLYEHMYDVDIISIRLADGSYVIAEEIDFDEDNGILYVACPVSLSESSDGNYKLREWMLFPEDEIVEISASHVISKAETPDNIIRSYLKFRFLKALHNQNDNTLPPVDNENTSDILRKKLDEIYKDRQGLN